MLTSGGSAISLSDSRTYRRDGEREEDRGNEIGRRLLPDVDRNSADQEEDNGQTGGHERVAAGSSKHRRQEAPEPDEGEPDPDKAEVEDPGHVLIIDHAGPD